VFSIVENSEDHSQLIRLPGQAGSTAETIDVQLADKKTTHITLRHDFVGGVPKCKNFVCDVHRHYLRNFPFLAILVPFEQNELALKSVDFVFAYTLELTSKCETLLCSNSTTARFSVKSTAIELADGWRS